MADDTSPSSVPRGEIQTSNNPSPPPAGFTPYNIDSAGNPRRLNLVSPGRMLEIIETGMSNGDRGPEPGFRDRPHGTDFQDDDLPGMMPLLLQVS